jgi:hypothetical protein
MNNRNTLPVVAGVEIPVDSEGRYNLNALHKASGLGPNKAPAQWLRTQQAQEFVSAVEKETMQICIVSFEGRNGGTFAHELVAVEYAGWISPSFRIKVNQTFIDYRTGKLQNPINDPIIAALVQGLVEIDALKQQQAALTRKTEQLESRVENVELQHRNGVPKGYLSRSQAQAAYGLGLSKEVFFLALRQLKVPTTSYIHHGEDGNDVATFAYLESDIADAVQAFLADSFQATPCMCESPLLNGKRFRYLKTSASDQALKKR